MWAVWIKDAVLFGEGRLLHTVLDDAAALHTLHRHVSSRLHNRRSFLHGLMMAALARRDYAADPLVLFPSVASVAQLMNGVDPEKLALHFYNSKLASAYGTPGRSARHIADDLRYASREGLFLRYPKDRKRLYERQIQDVLPGILLYRLEEARTHQQVFARHLRRGTMLTMGEKEKRALHALRPVCRTCQGDDRAEARLKDIQP